MVVPIQAKQIDKVLSFPILVTNFSVTGSSATVTTPITTALNTAGNGGVSLPLQVSSGISGLGVITSTTNTTRIWYTVSGDDVIDGSGNKVYGKITESGGVYTLSFFVSSDAGTETSYSFGSSTAINFEFNYRSDFNRFPSDSLLGIFQRVLIDDPSTTSGARTVTEKLTITAQNTVSNLTYTPNVSSNLLLIINGTIYNTFSPAGFSVSGKAITINSTNLKFNVETTDEVVACYTTTE